MHDAGIGGTDVAIEVVTLGEAMQLLVADPGIPLRRAVAFRGSVAGAETNVAIGLARLGHRVAWLGRLGADHSGSAVLSMLRAEAVDVSQVEIDAAGYTGLLMRDSHSVRDIDVQYYRAGFGRGRAFRWLRPGRVRS